MSSLEYFLLILNILLGIFNFIFQIKLENRSRLITKNNESIKDLNKTLFVGTSKSNSVMGRVLIALEKYDEALNCHDAQLKHVIHYLVEVLQVSDLLDKSPFQDIEIDNKNLIETLRDRIKWYKEMEKVHKDYYEED